MKLTSSNSLVYCIQVCVLFIFYIFISRILHLKNCKLSSFVFVSVSRIFLLIILIIFDVESTVNYNLCNACLCVEKTDGLRSNLTLNYYFNF